MNSPVQEFIDLAAKDWSNHPQPHLRLFNLRKLARFLHAEKSRILANPLAQYGPAVDRLEERLDWIREKGAWDQPDLYSLVGSNSKFTPAPAPSLPENFPVELAKKFQQYDRKWELSILCHALKAGWVLVELDAWVEISKIESWSEQLNDSLWPQATPLVTESGGFAEESRFWMGKWLIAAEPGIVSHLEQRVPISPGAPSPPRCELLFRS